MVIHSLTTPSPEEAPHGKEFLCSLNRFNVATPRLQSIVIVAGSPKLLEPDWRSASASFSTCDFLAVCGSVLAQPFSRRLRVT